MTDKQIPDWAIAVDQQLKSAAKSLRKSERAIQRARELSAQQPERYKFVTDAENGGGEIVDTSDNTSLAICWNGSETDALKIVSALNAQQPEAARGEQHARDGVKWPDYLMIRDTKLYDDMGGGGQRIYTTAGHGYEKVKYVRADLAQPQQQADGAAKHWHDLYRKECRLRQDDAARYGQEIIELEDRIAQPADGEAVGVGFVGDDGLFGASALPALGRHPPGEYRLYLHPTRGVEVTDGYDPNELLRAARHLIGGLMGGGKTDSGDLVLVDRIDQHLAALSVVQRWR